MILTRRTFLFLMVMMVFVQLNAQMPDGKYYHQLDEFPFVFVTEDSVSSFEISDSLFDASAKGIRFKVNRTELLPDDPFIPLYKEKFVPWLKNQNLKLRQVYVKGAASPEGPYDNNVRLSRERTKRLIDFLITESGQTMDSQQPVEAKSITEDYGLLVKRMKEANDPDYDRVNEVWLSCNGDEACCKKRLMALDQGRLWQRLLQEYYPALRQARVVLWYTFSVPQAVTPEPVDSVVIVGVPDSVPVTPVLTQYERRHLIAARTNLVHDLLYVPQFGFAYGGNIQLEYYPLRGHYTLNAGFTFTNHRHWSDNKFFQLRDAQLEVRRYFKGGGSFIGPYLGLYAEGTKYGIGFSKSKGWEGEGGGGGLSVGYTCALNRKGSLRLELSASLGLFYTRYDPYVYGNPLSGSEDGLYYYDYYGNTSDFKERNHQFTWFGPTNAGIHITYDIIYRKKKPVNAQQQKGGDR